MEMTQLRTFREMADTLNFTRAAERLNLTQSAVSLKGHRLRRTVAILSLGKFQPSPTRAFVEFVVKNKAGLQAMAEAEA